MILGSPDVTSGLPIFISIQKIRLAPPDLLFNVFGFFALTFSKDFCIRRIVFTAEPM